MRRREYVGRHQRRSWIIAQTERTPKHDRQARIGGSEETQDVREMAQRIDQRTGQGAKLCGAPGKACWRTDAHHLMLAAHFEPEDQRSGRVRTVEVECELHAILAKAIGLRQPMPSPTGEPGC